MVPYVSDMTRFGSGGFVDCYLQFVYAERYSWYKGANHGQISLFMLDRFKELWV